MKRVIFLFFFAIIIVISVSAQSFVTVYTTLDEPIAMKVFGEFEKEKSIKVLWTRLSGGEVLQHLEAEGNNPKASIWVGGVGLDHITAKTKGFTTPYKSPNAKNVPQKYKDKQNYWTGLYIGPLMFVVNTDLLKTNKLKAPQKWSDLCKADYKGYVRLSNPNTSGTAYNMLTTLSYIFNKNENKLFDYLTQLDANVDKYTTSGSLPGKNAANGEIPIAVGYAHDFLPLKINGAPIKLIAPKDGTGFEIASMSLIKNGKEPEEAKVLFDWLLTKRGQDIFAASYAIPVSTVATENKEAISIDKIKTVPQDFAWDGDKFNKDRLLKRWNDEIGCNR